ncbi:hypothetical protein GIB67_001337 [Kingdonia uniflora]|uniref:FCP1 homology domain-containing protein n=1 Tax=Kingdonia uniflora TaxID=39325 RepID=A0A7J7LLA9_9MAGN|nr:hypothetical protein GIB67_001337 [Kingdonia uniflora]
MFFELLLEHVHDALYDFLHCFFYVLVFINFQEVYGLYPFYIEERVEAVTICMDNRMREMPSLEESSGTSISDLCIYDSYAELGDITYAGAISDHDQMEFETIIDSPDDCILSCNEPDHMVTEPYKPFEKIEESPTTSDDSLYFALQQIWPLDHDLVGSYLGITGAEEHFNPYLLFTGTSTLPDIVPPDWLELLPREPQKRSHITLVLDLDETLVHSTLYTCESADFSFAVTFDMETHTVYVRQRPFLKMFLETVASMFEIVIFTAGESAYAEKLLDILDPDHTLISQRIYRDSCVFSKNGHTKDLTILGRDLARVAIVDNSPQVFQLQVDNGIPIESWYGDPTDNALLSLLLFLDTLVGADDVRPIIRKQFCGSL